MRIAKTYINLEQTNAKVAIYYQTDKDLLERESPYFPYGKRDLASIAYAFEQVIVRLFTFILGLKQSAGQ